MEKKCGVRVLAVHSVRLRVETIVMTNIVDGVVMVMGMDMIRKLDGVLISKEKVQISEAQCVVSIQQQSEDLNVKGESHGESDVLLRLRKRIFIQCFMVREGQPNGSRRVDLQC